MEKHYKEYDFAQTGRLVLSTTKPKQVFNNFKVTKVSNYFNKISSFLPSGLIRKLSNESVEDGIYIIHCGQPTYLIVINELAIKQHNYGLLIFSGGETKTRYLKKILERVDYPLEDKFLSYAMNYNIKEVYDVAQETGTPVSHVRKNIRDMIEIFGLDTVINEVGVKRVINEVGMDNLAKLLDKSEPKELRQLLDELDEQEEEE